MKHTITRSPYTQADFDWVHWTSSDILKEAQDAYKILIEEYQRIKKIPEGDRTFQNTIYALEKAGDTFGSVMSLIGFLVNVSPDKTIRQKCGKISETYEKKMIDLAYDEKIYEAFVSYVKKNNVHKEEEEKILKDMSIGYKRMGFLLPKPKRDALKKILKEKSKLSLDFSRTIAEYKDFITLTDKETAGLPTSFLEGLRRDKKGRYIVTLEYPDYIPFVELSSVPHKRKELVEKSLKKGGVANLKRIEKIVALRNKLAQMLGYDTYIDYQTENRMAENAKNVREFVVGLLKKVSPTGKKELMSLESLKQKDLNDQKAKLEFYDIAFYSYKDKHQKHNIDMELVKEYFPLDKVMEKTFLMYGKLLGITFKKENSFKLWHESVMLYKVEEKSGGLIGYLAFDLFPREGKFGHAAVFDIFQPYSKNPFDEKALYNPSFASMVANFQTPTEKRPSLLSHDQVETYLHEFGHLMHQTLSEVRYSSHSSFHTSLDYVEMPSQLFQEWVWNEEVLKFLSGHYQTGKPLPKEFIGKIIGTQQHLRAYATTRQLILSHYDQLIHERKTPKDVSLLYRNLAKEHLGVVYPKETLFAAGFGHLVGYGAGYYSYMWSYVYAIDMLGEFKRAGMMNPKIGMHYRNTILRPGASKKEMDMVKDFLGRVPNNKEFLKEIGIN